jgi:lipopolysaccharide cholinephosphotransferase
MLLLRCGFKIDDSGKLKKICYFLLKLFSHIKSVRKWKICYEKNADKYNDVRTKYVVSLGGTYSYKKELKSRELVSSYTKQIFEGIEFSVPKAYDEFLRATYGNYMELPPENQRVGKHCITLMDIGDYEIRSLQENDIEV